MTVPATAALNAIDSLSGERILTCLDKVLAAEEFSNSVQLSRFLRHIVENAVHGTDTSLKESAIGVAVFNRRASYDPKLDPIVRVEARRLRLRLDDYYRRTGDRDAVRICVPKGGYAPVFKMAQPEEVDNVRILPPVSRSRFPFRRLALILAILAPAILAAATLPSVLSPTSEPQRTASRFWSTILQADHPALLIPADSGLVMLQNLSHGSVSLQEYIAGDYPRRLATQGPIDSSVLFNLGTRRYTSIADLEFASRLSQRPEGVRRGFTIHYARDVRVGDLNGNNVILLGARQSNPWVELFERDATFRIDTDDVAGTMSIVNLQPIDGEPATIVLSSEQMQTEIYGIIAYHRHEAGSGVSLLVAGTTLAGTEAAADFVLDDNRLVPWLHKAEARGEFRGFDILVRARNLGGTAPRAEVVSFHFDAATSTTAR
jgi:hypothetical protein